MTGCIIKKYCIIVKNEFTCKAKTEKEGTRHMI